MKSRLDARKGRYTRVIVYNARTIGAIAVLQSFEGLRKRILENTKVITDKRSAARTPNFLTRLCVFPCLNTVTRTLLYGLLHRDPITICRQIVKSTELADYAERSSSRRRVSRDRRIFANSLRNA